MTKIPFNHRFAVVSVGIGVLLVVGTLGGGAFGAEASDTALRGPVTDGGSVADDGSVADEEPVTAGEVELQNESTENESNVPPNRTLEAMWATENQTNGTVVGARLRGSGDAEQQAAKFVYELDVLAANGTQLTAEVYADNATLVGVKPANESGGFLDDLFGSDDGVPDEARNASALRSATEAVQLAVNETEVERANQTVTEVTLESQDDALVYRVKLVTPDGEQREIIVAAMKDQGGVITTDS